MDKFEKVEKYRKETKKKVTCTVLPDAPLVLCLMNPKHVEIPPSPTLSALCFLQMELERKFKAKDGYGYLPYAQTSTAMPPTPPPLLKLSEQLHLHAMLWPPRF